MKAMRVLLVVLFVVIGLAPATTIEWVTDDTAVDQGWIDLLTSQGYTVNAVNQKYRNSLDDNGQAYVAELNAVDLVIISRKTSSGDYDGDQSPLWNGLTSPILCMTSYLARQDSGKWRWLPGATIGLVETMEVKDPAHPFFWGVPLDENNQVNIISAENADVVGTSNAGNGTVLATFPSNQTIWIATWETGVEYYVGSGQYAGGPRAFFGIGHDAVPGLNVNTAGQQLFLNMVYELSGATFDRPPFADAGGNHIIYLGDVDVVQLNGSAADPDSSPAVTWSQISGPSTAVFEDASSAVTTVTLDTVGTYVLQMEADDGTTVATDTATIHVLDHANDALLAHWNFESLPDPNTLVDVSGNGFDGVYYRTDSLSSDPNVVAGHITGSAVAGDFGDVQYWEVPNATSAVDPNFSSIATGATFAVWAKADAEGVTAYPMICGFGGPDTRFQVNVNRWNFTRNGQEAEVYSARPAYDGMWHNVVGVYDGPGAQFRIYIDGVLDGTQDVPGGFLLTTGEGPLQIGNRWDGDRPWPGQIDDIRVYNYALSESEIASLASEGDVPPWLTAGENQEVQYKGVAVQLDATLIIDDGIPAPMALTWEVTTAPAGAELGDIVFDDNTIEDPLVTFPNVAGTYIFKLTGNDGAVEVSDEVSIVLLIPTCADVLADGLGIVGDLSGPEDVPDCYVDIYDLAAMAAEWLICNNPEDATCLFPY